MTVLNPPETIELLLNGHSIGCVCPPTLSNTLTKVEIPQMQEVELIEVAFDSDVVLALDSKSQVLIDRMGDFYHNYPFYLYSKELKFSFYHPALNLIFDWEAKATIKCQFVHQWEKKHREKELDF